MIKTPKPLLASANSKGIAWMLLAIVLFTLMDAAAKGLIDIYPAPQVVWARFTGQAVLVLLFLSRRGVLTSLQTQHPWLHMLRSAFQLGATTFFFLSLAYIGLPEATALADISPILITLGAALFLGERLDGAKIFAVFIALIGALIIIRPGMGVFSLAALLPLACAVCFAGNSLLTRFIGSKETPWGSLLHAALFGCIALSLALPFFWTPIAPRHFAAFAMIGVLGTCAQFCIIRSFSIAEAMVVAPFTYFGILFATLWGGIFFGQYPDQWTIVGALVIVASGLYVWRHQNRGQASKPTK
jgi:drug/metabolite transporter (DMT)-like permease